LVMYLRGIVAFPRLASMRALMLVDLEPEYVSGQWLHDEQYQNLS